MTFTGLDVAYAYRLCLISAKIESAYKDGLDWMWAYWESYQKVLGSKSYRFIVNNIINTQHILIGRHENTLHLIFFTKTLPF